MRIRKIFTGILVLGWAALFAQNSAAQVQTFALTDVALLPGIFQQARQTDLHYMMQLNPDRLLSPYLREAGLKPKAPSYTNWENTGLDGHIGGHYLSALAMMYAGTNDKVVLELAVSPLPEFMK